MIIVIFLLGISLVEYEIYKDGGGACGALGIIMLVIVIIITFISYLLNAEDIGTIAAQDKVIAVYAENIEDLQNRLDRINPHGSALVNKDSPVAALVEAITDSNSKLAAAKAEKANAYVSIAKRSAGPFSFIVSLNPLPHDKVM